jgi:hypothetical protein
MKPGFRAVIVALMSAGTAMAAGQQKTEKPPNPVYLELSAEVATTTDDGYPAALRITVKNVGNVAVDMPIPISPCLVGGGGVEIHYQWHSNNPEIPPFTSKSWTCGRTHFPSLMNRVQDEWIRLHPGEFIVVSDTIRAHLRNLKPGIVEYWVEYAPPEVTPKEVDELQQAGYIIPTEKIETAHQTFVVH